MDVLVVYALETHIEKILVMLKEKLIFWKDLI